MIPQEEAVDPYRPPAVEILPPENAGDDEGPLKDPRLRGWIAGIAILLNCLALLTQFFQPDHRRWDNAIVALMSLTLLAAIISYLMWLYRCAGNALLIRRDADSATPGWATGSYFVPIANWWIPCKIMRDISRKTFLYRPGQNLDSIIIVWWIAFVLREVLGRFLPPLPAAIAGLALNFIAGITIFYIILRISQAQAAFRWSDVPESERPDMQALSGPRKIWPGLPPRSHPSQPAESEHTPEWDRAPRPRRPEKPADS